MNTRRRASHRRWYVTARHVRLRRIGTNAVEVPYAQGHLREPGASRTACGLPSLGWPILWLIGPSDIDVCSDCRRITNSGRNTSGI